VTAGPEVSLVIVAYEARDYVLRCLKSIEANVEISSETIVVDDGSGDGTAAAVRDRFTAARLMEQPQNRGLAAGRNTAISAVRGRKVLMLDSDTEVRPGAVEALVEYLDSHPEVGIAAPRLLNPDGSVQLSCRRFPSLLTPIIRRGPIHKLRPEPRTYRRHMMMDFDFACDRPVVTVMGAAQMWRADLPQRIGRFDERISSYGGEDTDWCLRTWEAGLEVHYVPGAEVVHDWQHVVRSRGLSRHSLRALFDFYYVQMKHRKLRSDRRMAAARA
jgi:GT2 family glycosyltransferase